MARSPCSASLALPPSRSVAARSASVACAGGTGEAERSVVALERGELHLLQLQVEPVELGRCLAQRAQRRLDGDQPDDEDGERDRHDDDQLTLARRPRAARTGRPVARAPAMPGGSEAALSVLMPLLRLRPRVRTSRPSLASTRKPAGWSAERNCSICASLQPLACERELAAARSGCSRPADARPARRRPPPAASARGRCRRPCRRACAAICVSRSITAAASRWTSPSPTRGKVFLTSAWIAPRRASIAFC